MAEHISASEVEKAVNALYHFWPIDQEALLQVIRTILIQIFQGMTVSQVSKIKT